MFAVLMSCDPSSEVGRVEQAASPEPSEIAPTRDEGALTGVLSVGHDGQARYSLPLRVVPGRSDMQPTLSFNYQSGDEEGEMGRGWSLGGASSISRCARTVATDGFSRSVRYDDHDAFCLDGKRLIKVSDGSGYSDYRTEDESFQLIRMYAGSSGPDTFRVRTIDGEVHWYGSQDENARRPLSIENTVAEWMISRVEDPFGNGMRFVWSEPTWPSHEGPRGQLAEVSLSHIEYTTHSSGLLANREVRFEYTTHSTPRTGYSAELAWSREVRLDSVSTWLDGEPVREYRVTYDASGATGASRVTEITECVNAPKTANAPYSMVCIPPTTFEWSLGNESGEPFDDIQSYHEVPSVYHGNLGPGDTLTGGSPRRYDATFTSLDANGDGATDVAFVSDDNLYLHLSTGSSLAPFVHHAETLTSIQGHDATYSAAKRFFVTDWNGDGRDDLVRLKRVLGSGGALANYELEALVSTGTDFVAQPMGLSIDAAAALIPFDPNAHYSTFTAPNSNGFLTGTTTQYDQSTAHMADFNGDGNIDFLACEVQGDVDCYNWSNTAVPIVVCGAGEWTIAWGNHTPGGGPGFEDEVGTGIEFPCGMAQHPGFGRAPIGDGTGDGLADVLIAWNDEDSPYELLSYNTDADAFELVTTNVENANSMFPQFADVNGDGLADIVSYKRVNDLEILDVTSTTAFEAGEDGRWRPHVALAQGDGHFVATGGSTPPGWGVSDRLAFSRYAHCAGGTIPSCSVSDRRYSVRPTPLVPMDVNGDGRVDPLTFTVPEEGRFFTDPDDLWVWGNANLAIMRSGAHGEYAVHQYAGTVLPTAEYEKLAGNVFRPWLETQPRAGDFDGDGDLDMMIVSQRFIPHSESPFTFPATAMEMHMNRRAGHERIIAVQDGVQNRTEIEYGQTSDSSIYTSDTDCEWPQRCDSSSRTVVSAVRHHAAAFVTPNERTYTYAGGRHDLLGRGWLGFSRRIETDGATGTITVHHLDNTTRDAATGMYPFVGRVIRRVTAIAEGDSSSPFPDDSTSFLATVDDTEFGVQHYGARIFVVETKRTQYNYEELEKVYPDLTQFDGLDVLTPVSVSQTVSHYDSALPFGERHVPTSRVLTHSDGRTSSVEQALEPPPAGEDASTSAWHVGRVAFRRSRTLDECAMDSSFRFYYATTHGGIERVVRRPDEFAPGRTSAEREQQWREVRLEFDGYGHVVATAIEDALGNRRKSSSHYGAIDDYTHMLWSENALGHRTHYTWRPRDGTQRSSMDPNGVQIWIVRDGFGRPRQIIAPGRPDQWIDYRTTGVFSTVETNQEGYGTSKRVYNARGELVLESISARGADGLPATSSVSYEYDAAGRTERSSEPYFGTTPIYWTEVERDGLGEVRRVTGTLAGDVRESWRRPFERHQRDGEGRTAEVFLDLNGEVKTSRGFGESNHMTFEYCADGRLLRAHDPHGNVSFAKYDVLGRLFSRGDPDHGATDIVFDGFDQVVAVSDAEDRFSDFRYDPLGRPIARTTSAGTLVIEYDQGGAIGPAHLTKSEDDIEQHFDFDSLGRLERHSQYVDGIDYAFKFTYDGFGRLRTREFPTSQGGLPFIVTYSYDDTHGGLDQVDGNMSGLLWQAGGAAAHGQLTHETFGNGFETNRTFVPGTSILETLTTSGTLYTQGNLWWPPFPYTETVQDWTYNHDHLGRVTSRHDAEHSFSESYTYHANGQLHTATASECAGTGGACTEEFLYDELGNMKWSTTSGSMLYEGLQPHAVSRFAGKPQQYDLTGNHLGDSVRREVVYDGRNLPVEINDLVTGADLKLRYDAAGQRAASDGPNGFRVYFGHFERRAEQEVYRVSVGGAVAEVIRNPKNDYVTTSYAHRGRRGSTEAVTSSNSVEMLANYAPFGETRDLGWTSADGRGFAGSDYGYGGHENEDAGGLIHMNARQFDPAMRTMTSPDPLVSAPYSVLGYNRYAYAFGDPINFGDPTGLIVESFTSLEDAAAEGDNGVERIEGGHEVTFDTATEVEVPKPARSVAQELGAIAHAARTGGSGSSVWDAPNELTFHDVEVPVVRARMYRVADNNNRIQRERVDSAFTEGLQSGITLGISEIMAMSDEELRAANVLQAATNIEITMRLLEDPYVAPTAIFTEAVFGVLAGLAGTLATANDQYADPVARSGAQGRLLGEGVLAAASIAAGMGAARVGVHSTLRNLPGLADLPHGVAVPTRAGQAIRIPRSLSPREMAALQNTSGNIEFSQTFYRGAYYLTRASHSTPNRVQLLPYRRGVQWISHTHPAGYSGLPSPADMRMLRLLGQDSSRVVRANGSSIRFGQ